jgi:hypothetical protein
MLAVLLLLWIPVGAAHNTPNKAECARTKQKIQKVQAQMRNGYTRARGERLAEKLRDLRKTRRRVCR